MSREIEKTNKELYGRAIEILKKHFIIRFNEEIDYDGHIWGRLVSVQWKEDKGNWDTTASANIANYKEDFEILKKVFCNEQNNT